MELFLRLFLIFYSIVGIIAIIGVGIAIFLNRDILIK